MRRKFAGFTLIELLIVVAIIGILAAIAIPNFLQAQVRAKVARAKGDIRTIALALETYCVDYGVYPADYYPYLNCWGYPLGIVWNPQVTLRVLTTPVQYLTSLPADDPFATSASMMHNRHGKYIYTNTGEQRYWEAGCGTGGENRFNYIDRGFMNGLPAASRHLWYIKSCGPDGNYEWWLLSPPDGPEYLYDPSNGTISKGEIALAGPG